jgi:hypothetical protein
VLLEVRAHVEAHAAQVERLNAQLERLDARVATLERLATPGATSSAARFQPSAVAHTRSLTLIKLSADILDKVVTLLDSDDELAASLVCRKLRDAICPPGLPSRAQPQRPLKTRTRSLLGSLGKMQWGIASVGAPLTLALFAHVAGLGDLRMLSWLRARWRPASEAGSEDSQDRPCDPCARAAAGGHLSALQWLRANGLPWDENACAEVARGRHLAVL